MFITGYLYILGMDGIYIFVNGDACIETKSYGHESIDCLTPSAKKLAPGPVDVTISTVISPEGKQTSFDGVQFTYLELSVDSITPEAGSTEGEYDVVIDGVGFGSDGEVHFAYPNSSLCFLLF